MSRQALPYDIIIGLEVHVQLLTASKLFCGCSTAFGRPPNTQTCPVCIGMPGTLPVMNRRAFELALKAAVALDCEIARFTKWDRKHYYYPDLPKNYQISQYDLPFSHDGRLAIRVGKGESPRPTSGRCPPERPEGCSAQMGTVPFSGTKDIGIIRVHLEEDAGKSMHDETAGVADSRIDLNRTGTPLLEIVSQPDLRSPAEAKAYLTELKLLLNYLGVSDCNMQEGSLRVDANINLHVDTPEGKAATPIVEVKNMNSFRAVERALAFEADRQHQRWKETGIKLGDPGGHKTTRGWDENAQVTKEQRTKEESSDYRYFPDPDLVPVTVSDGRIDEVRNSLGELPAQLRTRLEKTYGITPYDSDVIVNQGRELVDYYVELTDACGDGKLASNWVQQDVLRTLNEQQIPVAEYPVGAAAVGELLAMVRAGKLTTSRGREVLAEMLASGKPVEAAVAALGIAEVDDSELESLCRELIDANPGIVADVKGGKLKAAGALIGQAKKKNPNVDPGRVREICLGLIHQM